MSAQILAFPGCEAKPAKVKREPQYRLSKAMKAAIKKEPAPEKDELLQAARASWRKMSQDQDENEERLFLARESGKRPTPIRYMSLATCGVATPTFGEGGALFRWAIEATPKGEILAANEKDEALRLAVRTLNTLGLVARYGMLSGRNNSYGDDGKEAAEDFETLAIADLGHALKCLQEFGGRAEQTPSERKRDQGRYLKRKARQDAFDKAYDEARKGS